MDRNHDHDVCRIVFHQNSHWKDNSHIVDRAEIDWIRDTSNLSSARKCVTFDNMSISILFRMTWFYMLSDLVYRIVGMPIRYWWACRRKMIRQILLENFSGVVIKTTIYWCLIHICLSVRRCDKLLESVNLDCLEVELVYLFMVYYSWNWQNQLTKEKNKWFRDCQESN